MTLVVQLAPAPIPTLTQSTPESINAFVPSPVATFPAITAIFGLSCFIFEIVSNTPLECPCAVSMTMASISTFANSFARSNESPETPIAAATLSLPLESLQALGKSSFF